MSHRNNKSEQKNTNIDSPYIFYLLLFINKNNSNNSQHTSSFLRMMLGDIMAYFFKWEVRKTEKSN